MFPFSGTINKTWSVAEDNFVGAFHVIYIFFLLRLNAMLPLPPYRSTRFGQSGQKYQVNILDFSITPSISVRDLAPRGDTSQLSIGSPPPISSHLPLPRCLFPTNLFQVTSFTCTVGTLVIVFSFSSLFRRKFRK